jgi:hypothetical protein
MEKSKNDTNPLFSENEYDEHLINIKNNNMQNIARLRKTINLQIEKKCCFYCGNFCITNQNSNTYKKIPTSILCNCNHAYSYDEFFCIDEELYEYIMENMDNY